MWGDELCDALQNHLLDGFYRLLTKINVTIDRYG